MTAVDGRNPANSPVDMVNIPFFYRVLYIPGGCLGCLPSTLSGVMMNYQPKRHAIFFQVNLSKNYHTFASSFDSPNLNHFVIPDDVSGKSLKMTIKKMHQIFIPRKIIEPRKKKRPHFPLYWLFNRDPYVMVYYNPHIIG